jgi:predicted nucleotidyltransferase
MNFNVDDFLIFETLVGSKAYGTDTPDSDTDTKGVCIPPRTVRTSLFHRFEQYEDPNVDRVIYSLEKFMRLAAVCNPTILILLFIEPECWIKHTAWWEMLHKNHHIFLSHKYVKNAFSGYALAQLKRMKTHVRWMEKAPQEPDPADYGVSHAMLLGKDEIGSYDFLVDEGVKFVKEIQDLMVRVKRYKAAVHEFKNYQRWRENRNEKRALLEQKHGYDTKHAYHLVRLARLGDELLRTGKMTIRNRPDVQEFRDIRDGQWSYGRILEFAENVDRTLAESEAESVLPKAADKVAIDKLYREMVDTYAPERL